MKKNKNKPTCLSRRQFIGGCAAGVSFLHLAPYLSLTGCTPIKSKYPPIDNRKYYPLAHSEDELKAKLPEGTYPIIITEHDDGLKLEIIFPGFYSFDKFAFIDPEKRERKKFQYISIDKLGWSNTSGRPEIPFFGLLMHIPKFVDFRHDTILPSEDDAITYENMVIYPSQVKYFDNINNPGNYGLFEYDRYYYNSEIEVDKEKVVEISDYFDIGFSRFILIKIRPLQFNPHGQYLHGYKNVTIDFKFTVKTPVINDYYLETPFIAPHLEYIPEHERIIDPWCSKNPDGSRNVDLIKGMVDNFEPVINKTYVEEGKDLLIVYGEDVNNKISLAGPAKKLLEHKTRNMGMTASMISYPGGLAAQGFSDLTAFIRKSREPAFPGNEIHFPILRNIILMGDLDLIPCYYNERSLFEESNQNSQSQSATGSSEGSDQNRNLKKFYTDYYSSTLRTFENRNEIIIPDITIGRIPVKNQKDADTVVGNIIHYETSDYQVRQNLTFAGYFQDTGKDGYCCNGIASTDYLQALEEIRSKLNDPNNEISVNTIYDIQGPSFIGQDLRYRNGELVENPESLFTDVNLLKEKIVGAFRSGNRIILHRNHGYMNGWSRPNFKIPDLWALFDSGSAEIHSSVVFNINCLSGHFTGERTTRMPEKNYDCFSEVLIKGPVLPDGGRRNLKCPAVFASVEESPSMHNDWLIKAIFDGIYGGIISRTNNLSERVKLGNVINLGKALLLTCMDDPCLNMYENEIYHILGDPTIII